MADYRVLDGNNNLVAPGIIKLSGKVTVTNPLTSLKTVQDANKNFVGPAGNVKASGKMTVLNSGRRKTL